MLTLTVEIHVGDIFSSSWGHNMTRVNFYQVVKVSKTGKSVTVREINRRIVDGTPESSYGYRVTPVKNDFIGEEIANRRVKPGYGERAQFRVDEYEVARLLEDINPQGYRVCDWD